jgi:hypothetical protein
MANRRTRSAAIRRSFAQGIRGSAAMPCCLTNPARTTPARLDRVRRAARRRLRGLHQRRLLIRRHVFLKCAASRGARKSALTEVVPALRRPRWSAPVRRRAPPKRLRDVDCAMRTPPRQDCNTRSPAQNLQHQTLRGLPQSTGEGATPRSHRSRGLECPASTTARRMLCHLRV